jgi:hypothetical protein
MGSICRKCIWTAFLLMVAAVGTGCCMPPYDPKPFDVGVKLSDQSRDANAALTVKVDLIGVNDTELERLRTKSMDEYWSGNDQTRESADKVVIELRQEHPGVQMLQSDPTWKSVLERWQSRGVVWMVVLSNYPRVGTVENKPGDEDPRRRILPLRCNRWNGTPDIKIRVSRDGLVVDTPPLPAPQ